MRNIGFVYYTSQNVGKATETHKWNLSKLEQHCMATKQLLSFIFKA